MARKYRGPAYRHLQNKWTDLHNKLQKKVLQKHGDAIKWVQENSKQVAVGSVGGLMMLAAAPQVSSLPVSRLVQPTVPNVVPIDDKQHLISQLRSVLPTEVRPLKAEEEQKVGGILSDTFGFRVNADLGGRRLNRTYGYIGQEQHLARYPGDTIATHFDTEEEAALYAAHGMAPGLGAWRYFAPSKEKMTELDNKREKYYIAVQTFLTPGFYENVVMYRDFFKFRKMLVVNPENGKAIITVIGDAGPADWTGKHLGGSPEVMKYLERVDGAGKGPVLYFFIDDPDDTIPLGPIYPQ